MTPDEAIVQAVIGAARLVNPERRAELSRELLDHLSDLRVDAVRGGVAAGRLEAEVRERFGAPEEIGRALAGVYRWERVRLYSAIGLSCVLALTLAGGGVVYGMQFWMTQMLGYPVFALGRHFWSEVVLIAATLLGFVMLRLVRSEAGGHWAWPNLTRASLVLGGAFGLSFPDNSWAKAVALGSAFAALLDWTTGTGAMTLARALKLGGASALSAVLPWTFATCRGAAAPAIVAAWESVAIVICGSVVVFGLLNDRLIVRRLTG